MVIKRIFENHFEAKSITNNRLHKFTEDHIQRLTANNTEESLTDMISETVTNYTDFQGAIQDEHGKIAQQRSLTRAKDQKVQAFIDTVRLKEGVIRGTWGANSPEYKAFFPGGLKAYLKMNLSTAETLMTSFVNTATQYVDTLGQPFVDQFKQLKDDFVAARTAQLQQFGEVAESRSITQEKRQALEKQLNSNVYNLALKFLDDPKRGMDFFDQSIIRRPRREPVETPSE